MYTCMCFGWYYELLGEVRVSSFSAAERELLRMLDGGGMTVHVYREGEPNEPEMVGRHWRLGGFLSGRGCGSGAGQHEVERFLLDGASAREWVRARQSGEPLEERWSVVELWGVAGTERGPMHGRATRMTA
jgi:hypothetical protein